MERKTEEVYVPDKPNGKIREEEGSGGGPVFVPQLYLQRYYFVQQQLLKYKVTSVVDFGCAECKICRYFAKIPSLQQITLVDIDHELLESSKHAIRPQASDYLKRRSQGLSVKVYCGSVTELDAVVTGCDAVTLVEVIEHLQSDVLKAACSNVFGSLKPRLIVMTTPNAEYNQLFPGLTGMRHWDHKFEWNRAEFQSWCQNLAQGYRYTVQFDGIGDPPPGSESLGHCSQAAIFTRLGKQEPCGDVGSGRYTLITECSYPIQTAYGHSLNMEIEYILNQYKYHGMFNDDEEDSDPSSCQCLVPLAFIMKFRQICSKFSELQLRKFLTSNGYNLSPDRNFVVVEVDKESSSDDEEETASQELSTTDSGPPCLPLCTSGSKHSSGAGPRDCDTDSMAAVADCENWD